MKKLEEKWEHFQDKLKQFKQIDMSKEKHIKLRSIYLFIKIITTKQGIIIFTKQRIGTFAVNIPNIFAIFFLSITHGKNKTIEKT